MHVRAHQSPVGIIVLQERYQSGGYTDQLLGRNIHIIHFLWGDQDSIFAQAAGHPVGQEATFLIQKGVGLCNYIFIFVIGGKIHYFVGNNIFFFIHTAVRGLNKPVFVDTRIGA